MGDQKVEPTPRADLSIMARDRGSGHDGTVRVRAFRVILQVRLNDSRGFTTRAEYALGDYCGRTSVPGEPHP
jgi:hypothetical protein